MKKVQTTKYFVTLLVSLLKSLQNKHVNKPARLFFFFKEKTKPEAPPIYKWSCDFLRIEADILTLCGHGQSCWSCLQWTRGSCSPSTSSCWSAGTGWAASSLTKAIKQLLIHPKHSTSLRSHNIIQQYSSNLVSVRVCSLNPVQSSVFHSQFGLNIVLFVCF